MMYSKGQGVQPNSIEAAKWYRKAADQGNPAAMNNLSWLFATGANGNDRNPQKAVEFGLQATGATQEHIPEYLDTLANAYYANKQYDEALSAEQKALALKPDDKSYQQLSKNYFEVAKAAKDLPSSLSTAELHFGPGVTAPRAVFTPDPEPPVERWYGTVVVSAVVGPDGRVQEPQVAKSVNPDVDAKALDAIQKWVFQPAQKDGKPGVVRLNVEVAFPFKPQPQM